MKEAKHLKNRVQSVTDMMNSGIIEDFVQHQDRVRSGKEAVAPATTAVPDQNPVLTPPQQLFQQAPRPVISYTYSDNNKYVSKKDFNKVVDSLTQKFSGALKEIYNELDNVNDINKQLLIQSQGNQDRWEFAKTFVGGGGLTALLTALTSLAVVLRRKKNREAK